MNYEDYLFKIKGFNRNSILYGAMDASWKSQDSKRLVTTERQKIDQIKCRAYAPRLFCISAAIGNNFTIKRADQDDILKLVGLHLEIDEAISIEKFTDSEVAKIQILLPDTIHLKDYNIPIDILRLSTKILFLSRIMRSQHDSASASSRHLVRSWMIYEKLNERSGGRIDKATSILFGMTPLHVLRSAFGIDILCSRAKHPGILNFKRATVEKELEKRYQINLDTVKLLSSKISTNKNKLGTWHDQEVLQLPEPYRKYAPLPLHRSPLLMADELFEPVSEGAINNIYFCPSPHILMASLSELMFRELLDNADNSSTGATGIAVLRNLNVSSLLGYAIEDYLALALKGIFKGFNINKISDKKGADFIVETDHFVYVIECKKAIGSIFSKTVCSPEGIVEIWDRLLESYKQCAYTTREYKASKINKRPVLSIVVTLDTISEQSVFDFTAYRSGILASLEISYIEVLALDDFERIFELGDPTSVGNDILTKWEKVRAQPSVDNFYSLQVKKRGKVQTPLIYLKNKINEIFPTEKIN